MSQYKQWNIQIFNKRTNAVVDDSTGKAVVMNSAQTLAASATLVSVVADQNGSALSQPITLSSGLLTFFTAKTVTAVDVSILTSDGFAIYAKGISANVHRLDVYPEQRLQVFTFPMIFIAGGTVQDTGFDMPVGMLITDVAVQVVVLDAGETVDIGFINAVESGDEDGLAKLVTVANLGFPTLYPVVTGGANIDYLVETAGYGAYLAQAIAGADVVATNGGWAKRNYPTDGTIKSLSYTVSGSDTFRGLAHVAYLKLA
jgi:hypothetical protein